MFFFSLTKVTNTPFNQGTGDGFCGAVSAVRRSLKHKMFQVPFYQKWCLASISALWLSLEFSITLSDRLHHLPELRVRQLPDHRSSSCFWKTRQFKTDLRNANETRVALYVSLLSFCRNPFSGSRDGFVSREFTSGVRLTRLILNQQWTKQHLFT